MNEPASKSREFDIGTTAFGDAITLRIDLDERSQREITTLTVGKPYDPTVVHGLTGDNVAAIARAIRKGPR